MVPTLDTPEQSRPITALCSTIVLLSRGKRRSGTLGATTGGEPQPSLVDMPQRLVNRPGEARQSIPTGFHRLWITLSKREPEDSITDFQTATDEFKPTGRPRAARRTEQRASSRISPTVQRGHRAPLTFPPHAPRGSTRLPRKPVQPGRHTPSSQSEPRPNARAHQNRHTINRARHRAC